jgi:site-specific DNA recombinase
VQNVLDGKKKAKTKYSTVNDEYPMRGYLVCPRCGKTLTGSSALGNGGKYFYYHCTKGCKERHKNEVVHHSFESWLKDISVKPEIASLYMAIMEDIFKTNEGDREREIKKLQALLEKNKYYLETATTRFLDDEIDKNDLRRIKEKVARESVEYQRQITNYRTADSGYKEYCRYGFSY